MTTSLYLQDVGSILDHYADVIEGGNSHAGGSAQAGIPGRYSSNKGLRSGSDTPLTVVGSSVSTTTFDVTGVSWPTDRWVSSNAPPYFALCTTSGAAGNPNLYRSRKITNYNDTTKVFTVQAFPSAPVASDVMAILQGFKRAPNDIDIEDDDAEIEGGFDRVFHLSADVGSVRDHHGDGFLTFVSTLHVRLRIEKFGRLHDWTASALTNLGIIRAAITKSSSYPSSYVRALIAANGAEPEIVADDIHKIVVRDSYTLVYRIDGTVL